MNTLAIDQVNSPIHILRQIHLPWDAVLVVIGVLILITAWRSYKAIIMANCAAIGWYIGMYMVHWSPLATAAAALGGTLVGLLLVPVMRVAAIVTGAILGCAVGMALWSMYHQPVDFRWVAGAAGVLVLGVAGLYLFQVGVIIVCTIEGAIFAVMGGVGLLLRIGPPAWKPELMNHVVDNSMNLGALVFSLTCLGLLCEYWQFARAERRREEKENS
jgi:hypothetical protein